jgi:hypothetical protein
MIDIVILKDKEEDAYANFLERCSGSLIQHSLDWGRVINDLGKDKPFFIVAKENGKIVGALPMYFYECRLGNLLTTIAWHSISGIVCRERNASCHVIYKALLDYCVSLARDLNCVAVSIATNPFLDDKEYYLNYFKPDYIMENFVQCIDLKEIFDETGSLIHPNYMRRSSLTRNLKKARLKGIVISDEQTQANIDEWFAIHEKRMNELGAAPIPKKLFDSVFKNLIQKGKGKFLFAFHGKKMISGGLFIFNKRIIDVYMISVDSRYVDCGTNYLIAYHMLEWANKNGISVFNWESIPGRKSGAYGWKEQWGSRERVFLYVTRILGDISGWRELGYQALGEAYRWHYLLPFNLLKSAPLTKFTTKDELVSFLQSLS